MKNTVAGTPGPRRETRIAPLLALCGVIILFLPGGAAGAGAGAGVLSSPHNLSASGGKGQHGIAFPGEQRVCIFCHAPHNAQPGLPLWNRDLSTAQYTPYDSTTLQATPKPSQPTGASRLCLSCHDGTIALNSYGGKTDTGAPVLMPSDAVPTNNPNLTTDLSKDHPISFSYTADLAIRSQLNSPAALPPQIRLESGEVLQCTSCHDPHDNTFGNFLVIDNTLPGSPLCTACHNNTGWSRSSHNPLQTAGLTAGCMSCHYTHNAPAPVRLLKSVKEEDNCITSACHNNGTSPPSANVAPLFSMLYRHPVEFATGVHDEKETDNLAAMRPHVECVDCHNPHQANNTGIPLASPPLINGTLQGVMGVNKDTLGVVTASNEYEVCFKCHSGSIAGNFTGITATGETQPNRQINQPDLLKCFKRGQTSSYHPVTDPRPGTAPSPSLLTPLQNTMFQIYCNDCHNSDQSAKALAGGTGPNGPHGSMTHHILIAQYDMPMPSAICPPSPNAPVFDFTTRYALCFRCHSDVYVMGSNSGFSNLGTAEHSRHVQDRGIPCFACHDPHGVPVVGLPPAVSTHLVNFNLDYTAGCTVPIPTYTPTTLGGSCTVKCHTNSGQTHSYTR